MPVDQLQQGQDRFLIQGANFILALLLNEHKPAVGQASQIMRNHALLDAEGLANLSNISRALPEEVDDSQPGVIR